MKPTFTIVSLAAGLTAAAGLGAEPAPKLVPRPLPGLGVVQPVASPAPAAEPAPFTPKVIIPAPAANGENQTRARVLFIHRRDSLPPELTANLPKPEAKAEGKGGGSVLVPARSGKVRIIPKAAVAAMMARNAEDKPAAPTEP
jgi:hypothetical protein